MIFMFMRIFSSEYPMRRKNCFRSTPFIAPMLPAILIVFSVIQANADDDAEYHRDAALTLVATSLFQNQVNEITQAGIRFSLRNLTGVDLTKDQIESARKITVHEWNTSKARFENAYANALQASLTIGELERLNAFFGDPEFQNSIKKINRILPRELLEFSQIRDEIEAQISAKQRDVLGK